MRNVADVVPLWRKMMNFRRRRRYSMPESEKVWGADREAKN